VTSFGVVAPAPVHDPLNRIYAVPFGESWLVRGSTAAAGSVLEWARELFGLDIAEIDRLALAEPLTPDDPVFVPYLSGARAPLWRPRARGSLTGLSIATRRPELCRALYAGLALSLRHIVDTIESTAVPVGSIRLAGGLARSPALSQLKADILQRPVTVLREIELTTTGLAAIGAAALGAFPDIAAAARQFSHAAQTYAPRADRAAIDRLHARYLSAAGLSVSLVQPRNNDSSRVSAA
jgi:xylulokinase